MKKIWPRLNRCSRTNPSIQKNLQQVCILNANHHKLHIQFFIFYFQVSVLNS